MFKVDCSKIEKLEGIIVMWQEDGSNVKMLPTSDYRSLLEEELENYKAEKFGDVQEAIEWILENLPSVCK